MDYIRAAQNLQPAHKVVHPERRLYLSQSLKRDYFGSKHTTSHVTLASISWSTSPRYTSGGPNYPATSKNLWKHAPPVHATKNENLQPAGLLQPLPSPKQPWANISLDFVTRLPPSDGFSVILTVVDQFSKASHFIPLKKTSLCVWDSSNPIKRGIQNPWTTFWDRFWQRSPIHISAMERVL